MTARPTDAIITALFSQGSNSVVAGSATPANHDTDEVRVILQELARTLMKPRARWMLLLPVVVALFFWKILLSHQFTPFLNYDDANQAYAWDQFAASSVKHGVLPLWDPYTYAGHSFIGEMQTALFYPLKIILYLWPLDDSGLFSLELLHGFYVLGHILGAFFMYLLAEELGLGGFPAFVAGVCFSLGGFVGRVGWPNMLDSAIWLPLILLCLLRALGSPGVMRGILYAALSGLALGMAILAGSLHVAVMDALVIVTTAAYFGFRAARESQQLAGKRFPWMWSAVIVVVVAVVSFGAGAVQLLPSVEYSQFAVRYRGGPLLPLPAMQKAPYGELIENFLPHSLLCFLLGGMSAGALAFSPYFGVLPLVFAVMGVWRNWDRPWVRYLAGLAVLAFFYTLGPFSFLHGLLYALVPFLWMTLEAGRFIYLTHFAAALLAGFGVQALFSGEGREALAGMAGVLKWVVIAVAGALTIPALSWKPEMNEWMYFSLLLWTASYGLFVYILRVHRAKAAQFALVAVIACDLYAFNWTIANRQEAQRAGKDHLDVLLRCRDVAKFLKSQPGLFRAQMQVGDHPNLGDVYGVQTTGGKSATLTKNFQQLWEVQQSWEVPRVNDLLNVRFFVRPQTASPGPGPLGPAPRAGASEPAPVYQDSYWKVYENPTYLPRGWVVGRMEWEPSREKVLHRIGERGFDPLREALVRERVAEEPGGWGEGARGEVSFEEYHDDRIVVRVKSPARGMLVLSEMDYPGWRAMVNGQTVRVYEVDGFLRGVVVPSGQSQVVLRYQPLRVLHGALLSALAFLGTLIFAAVLRAKERAVKLEGE